MNWVKPTCRAPLQQRHRVPLHDARNTKHKLHVACISGIEGSEDNRANACRRGSESKTLPVAGAVQTMRPTAVAASTLSISVLVIAILVDLLQLARMSRSQCRVFTQCVTCIRISRAKSCPRKAVLPRGAACTGLACIDNRNMHSTKLAVMHVCITALGAIDNKDP